MKYKKEELKKIYEESKIGSLSFKELKPIEDKLIMILKEMDEEFIPLIEPLINTLFRLKKENQLDKIDKDLIKVIKTIDLGFFNCYLNCVTYNDSRLTKDIKKNEMILKYFASFFITITDILKDKNSIEVLKKYNSDLLEVSLRYVYLCNNLNEFFSNKEIILTDILSKLATYIYLNINILGHDYMLLDKVFNKIKDNYDIYLDYFISQGIYDMESLIGPVSSGGFNKEFIVIGEIARQEINKTINYDKSLKK